MSRTSIRLLAGIVLVVGAVGYVTADWIDSRGRLPAVPWLAVLMIWVVAGFVAAWAIVARRRLHPLPGQEPMATLVTARLTALALAGSRTGAFLAGLYGGLGLRLVQETAVAAGRERLLASVIAAVGGLVLAIVSLWLERICSLPQDGAGGGGPTGRRRAGEPDAPGGVRA